MDILAQTLAQEAEKETAAAQALFAHEAFPVDAKLRASYLVTQNAANMLKIASTVVEYLAGMKDLDDDQVRRNALRERFHAVRTAEIQAIDSGDWTAWNRLADSIGGPPGGG